MTTATLEAEMKLIDPRYTLLSQVGAGGMGVVYRAQDRLSGQIVALKSVRGDYSQTESGDTAFDKRLALAEEFQTLASLRHPYIISVIDYGFDSTRHPYFTMDLLDAPQTILQAAQKASSLEATIGLLTQILQALAYLHRRGILHRDLKPGNILVQNGHVKLLDFGLATAQNSSGIILGTPAYMSPELIQGKAPTQASDLYAVGVIAYEMVTGVYPFNMATLNTLIASILQDRPDLSPFSSMADDQTIVQPADAFTDSRTSVIKEDDDSLLTMPVIPVSDVFETLPPDMDRTIAISGLALPDVELNPEQVSASLTAEEQQRLQQKTRIGMIIQRLLIKDPSARYQNASEVIRDLEKVLDQAVLTETAAARESFLQSARFIGRHKELDQLLSALAGASRGNGSTWLIGGESGVGKSRLMDELRTRARVSGALVLEGVAAELDAPYQMWRDPLRRLALNSDLKPYDASVLKAIIPDIDELAGYSVSPAAPLEPDQASKRLLSAIMSLFSNQRQPIVVALEDLHNARSENLAVLEQLTQIAATLPLLIVGGYRTDQQAELPPLLRKLPTLTLERFTQPEVAALAELMLGEVAQGQTLPAFLQQETEGNPLFIVEVVRALADSAGKLSAIDIRALPKNLQVEGIQRLLQNRLAQLPADASALLQSAALIGRTVDPKLMRVLAPTLTLENWLFTCSEAAVLEIRDEQWQFSHDKLRQEVLRGLPDDQRPVRNRQAAQAIETAYPDAPDRAPLLMSLWAAAGDPQKERRYAMLAGEQAYQASAAQDALTYLQRAQTLLAGDNSPEAQVQHVTVLINLAKTQMYLNEYAEAVKLAEESLSLPVTATNPALHAETLWILGYSSVYQGDPTKGTTLLEQSLALYHEIGNQRGTSEVLRGLARINSAQGNYPAAI